MTAHGNRWRQHHRADGTTKVTFATYREAKMSTGNNTVAYKCASCRRWHTGEDKRVLVRTDLGERVDLALRAENSQSPSKRRKYIIAMGRKAAYMRAEVLA